MSLKISKETFQFNFYQGQVMSYGNGMLVNTDSAKFV